jgi:hypothetical protein
MVSYIGINIGALTVKVVSLGADRVDFRLMNHRVRPFQVERELLREVPSRAFFGASGHLGRISEVAATEAALEYVHGDFDAVASLGGEAFTVYLLEGTRVLSVLAPDKCAAGSGEFFVQQIGCFGLDLEEAIERSFAGHVVPLASRCSVHCKSDVTHKRNRQEANDYYGLNRRKLGQFLASLIMLAELFLEMEQSLRVVGEPGSLDVLRECWSERVDSASSPMALNADLETLIKQVSAIPHTDPAHCPKAVVTGDFFTRLSPSFMGGVHGLSAKHGIILIPVDLNELYLYGAYAGMVAATQDWGVPPDSLRALALACAKAFRPEGRNYVISRLKYHQLKYYDERYRRLFGRTGLLVTGLNDMYRLFQHASQHISPAVFSEAIPTVGKALAARDEGYQGITVIGPFNCLPFRISQAILKPYCIQQRMPILTYESDGFSVSPAFLRQVDVHIQQVLGNASAKRRSAAVQARGGL